MNVGKLKKVEELLAEEKASEAYTVFQTITPTETVKYWMVKGKLEQKFQHWSEAINAFAKILELEPENSEAQNQLHFIQNILNFWNPEMFNP